MRTSITALYTLLTLFTLGSGTACAGGRPKTPTAAKRLLLQYASQGDYQKMVALSKKGKIRFASYKKGQKAKGKKVKSGSELKAAMAKTPYPAILSRLTDLSVKKKRTKKKNKVRYVFKYKAPNGKMGMSFIFKVKQGTLYLKKIKLWYK